MARGETRGITISLGGDASPLLHAFREAKTEANHLGKDLAALNKAAKFDPENTELLRKRLETARKQAEELKKAD